MAKSHCPSITVPADTLGCDLDVCEYYCSAGAGLDRKVSCVLCWFSPVYTAWVSSGQSDKQTRMLAQSPLCLGGADNFNTIKKAQVWGCWRV